MVFSLKSLAKPLLGFFAPDRPGRRNFLSFFSFANNHRRGQAASSAKLARSAALPTLAHTF